jgi:uncharacterized protein with GYD domain
MLEDPLGAVEDGAAVEDEHRNRPQTRGVLESVAIGRVDRHRADDKVEAELGDPPPDESGAWTPCGLEELEHAATMPSPAATRIGNPHGSRLRSSRVRILRVAHYISLIRWTSQGRMGLPAWRDRVEDGAREIEEAGGKLIAVWVTLGRYDVVEVFEAPNDDTALEIVTKLSHHGAEQTETLRAFTRDEAERIIKKL